MSVDFVEAMKKAALIANQKGIPVILDACGVRDRKCFEPLDTARISIIKGEIYYGGPTVTPD